MNYYQPQPTNGAYYQGYSQAFNQQGGSIAGRFVPDSSAIMARDVPMSDTFAIFPRNDMAEIYAKRWNGQGGIDTVVYKPIADTLGGIQQPRPEATLETVIQRQDEMLASLEKLAQEIRGGNQNGHSSINPETSNTAEPTNGK